MQRFLHLMPHASLDLDYDKEYKASCVPSNPISIPRSDTISTTPISMNWRWAKSLFSTAFASTNIIRMPRPMPSPIVPASALARRANCGALERFRTVGIRDLAEEQAMIDCITGGRLISGMVRGIGAEYYSMGANPAFSQTVSRST